ncbi:MAG: archaemetzincin [Kofleriaceae bacterium]
MSRLVVAMFFAAACSSDSRAPDPPPIVNKVITDADRRDALGDVTALAPELQRTFDLAGFEPIRTPHANDWLDVAFEPGQTFAQHRAGNYNVADARRRVICLVPLGELAQDMPRLGDLATIANAFYGLDVHILPAVPLDKVEARRTSTIVAPRGPVVQLYVPDLLRWLGTQLPADAHALLAITMMDLAPEKSSFVFGMASFRERVAVQSFARIDPAFYDVARKPDYRRLVLDRAAWTMIHELGHTFGLQHRVYFTCVFAGTQSHVEMDRHPLHASDLHSQAPCSARLRSRRTRRRAGEGLRRARSRRRSRVVESALDVDPDAR